MPSAAIGPGERTGKFRLGKDQLLTTDKGSSISWEDYAIAAVDELERPAHSASASPSATDRPRAGRACPAFRQPRHRQSLFQTAGATFPGLVNSFTGAPRGVRNF